MNSEPLRYYDFGPFRLSISDRMLLRDGEVVALTPKVVDTLVLLVENRGHVVKKNDLMETLWPDSFVEESSLTQNISLLRKALAESAADRYIETVPKRGYRFIADVREVLSDLNGADAGTVVLQERVTSQVLIEEQITDLSSQPQAVAVLPSSDRTSRKPYLIATGVCLLLLTGLGGYFALRRPLSTPGIPKSIAVLPFNTIGVQSENELLGLGMADAVILRLTRLDGTTVLPTSSVYKYTKRDKDVAAIGRELGVEAILDGTVQRDGDRVRVSAVLIRLVDGKAIWSHTLDSPYTTVFSVQDTISNQFVAALAPSFRQPTVIKTTNNPDARRAYVTGLYFWNLRSSDNLQKAISYLEDAVKRDPDFALAHAVLADAYYLSLQDGFHTGSRDEAMAKARNSVARALALDENIAEAHTTKAGIAFSDGKYDEADQEFRRAIELNPNYALAHLRYGYLLFANGRLTEAVAQMRLATELDPVSPVSHIASGTLLSLARDFDGAIRENRKAIELQPDSGVGHLNLAENYAQKRMFKEAEAELDFIASTGPRVFVSYTRAYVYAASGRSAEALRLLAEIQRDSKPEDRRPFEESLVHTALGDKEAAIAALQKTTPTRTRLAMLKHDARFDPLRSDQRFTALASRPPV